MVAPAVGIGVLENEKVAVPAYESQIHRGRRPQNADFSFEGWISILALPVGGEADGRGQFPFHCWICRIQLDVASYSGGNDFGTGGHSRNEHNAEKLVCPQDPDSLILRMVVISSHEQ